jgi:protein involved in polysaccharide export with SLBB domain
MVETLVRAVFLVVAVLAFDSIPVQAQGVRPALRLRAGDAVHLEVRDEPALRGEYRVVEDGSVLLPLVGLIAVAGRDFEDVRRDVVAAFRHQLTDREVRVIPLMRVTVLGEARQPGLFDIDPTMTLSDVVARAGGFGPEANRGHIELVRDGRVIAVLRASDLPAFPGPLASGDQVVLGRLGWVQRNSVALIGTAGSLLVALVTGLILR